MGFLDSLFSKKKSKIVEEIDELATQESELEPEIKLEEEIELEDVKQSLVKIESGKVISMIVDDAMPPTITTNEQVIMTVNGEPVMGTHSIKLDDIIELLPVTDTHDTYSKITTDSKKMKTELYVKPGYTIERIIKNGGPSSAISIEVLEKKIAQNNLLVRGILEELKTIGIVAGINRENIEKAAETLETLTIVIAEGTPAKEGENGNLSLLMETKISTKLIEREDKTVNYRDSSTIPAVEQGEEVAIIKPAKEGENGNTVAGDVIPYKPVHDIQVKPGRGISINNKGTIIADTHGRPHIEKRGTTFTVEVVSIFTQQGDLTIRNGNIRFKGDVEIQGGVEPGMVVDAYGSIDVKGTVIQTTLQAGQSVSVGKNTIKSEIIAGAPLLGLMKNKEMLVQLDDQVQQFIIAVKQVIEKIKKQGAAVQLSDNDMNQLMVMIIKTKFTSLPALTKKAKEHFIYQLDINEDWRSIIMEGERMFTENLVTSFREIEFFADLLKDLREKADIIPTPAPHVMIPYCLNSNITSAGHVTIQQTCHNTNIVAYGDVRVEGAMRGGEIRAFGNVFVKDLGTKFGTPTRIIVPVGKSIKAEHVAEETIIQVGLRMYKFIDPKSNLNAHIDENGQLLLD